MAKGIPSKLLIGDLYPSLELILTMDLLLTIAVIALAIFGMSVGIIFNNKPLQGSCGGVASDCVCLKGGTCDDPSQKPEVDN
ncbi:MAG: hypothetical protein OXT08_08335 [Candidatus Marinimicrobia bacterium]|nr:hypothetical protein [Candidatus Neomarinimicrobiota bacterium]